MMLPRKAPIAKRAHKKSKNGCRQCKVRKVKCDERRPLCGNCAKHFDGIYECDFPLDQIGLSRPHDVIPRDKYPSPVETPPYAQTTDLDARRKAPMPQLLASLGAVLDPFKMHPDSNVPEAQFLMHHYFSNFTTKTFPIVLDHETKPLVESWWEWAGHDAVLFHATIHLSALHLSGLRGDENGTHSKFLLNRECIRLLRERVGDPVLSLSNQTIGSVLFLIIIEFERGNSRMVRMHMKGLKRMVKMRGGLNAIGASNVTLANMIFGISWTVMTEPQFKPDIIDPAPPDRWGAIGQDDPRLARLEDFGVTRSYARQIREVIYMTNLLTGEEIGEPKVNYCSDVMCRLMSLEPPTTDTTLTISISEAAREATAIEAMCPFMNDYPNPRLRINVQLHKLKKNMEVMMGMISPDHVSYRLLPWMLGVGGLAAIEPEKSWFICQLITVAEDLDIRTYGDFKPYCTSILWAENLCEAVFLQFWREVAKRRDRLNLVDSW